MEEKKEKVKKYVVTRSLRMPTKWMKLFFWCGLIMGATAVVLALSCLISGTTDMLGLAMILLLLGAIWISMVVFNSMGNFGVSMISFNEKGIKFYFYKEEYQLDWEKAVCGGIEKTRWSYWVYISDHELSATEKKEFPEHAESGVMYYNYSKDTWDEMMKFIPEAIKAELKSAKANTKIK